MKNPFVKKDNTVLIAAVAIGTVVAGTVAYLYLTDSGSGIRDNVKEKAKNIAKDVAVGWISRTTGIAKEHLNKAAKAV